MYNFEISKKNQIFIFLNLVFIFLIFLGIEENLKTYALKIVNNNSEYVNYINLVFFKFKIVYVTLACLICLYILILNNYFINDKIVVYYLTPLIIFFCWLANYYIFPNRSFFFNDHLATHWLFNYFDHGFIKRGLAGTIIEIFSFNFKKNYYFIFFISCFIFLILSFYIISLWRYLNKNKNLLIFFIIILTSPSLISFFISDLGRFDQINYILLALLVFHILEYRNNYNIYYILFLITFSILNHEQFVLIQFPIFYSYLFFLYIKEYNFNLKKINFVKINLIFIYVVILTIIVYKYGFIENFDLQKIKVFLEHSSNYKTIENSPIETYNNELFNYKFVLKSSYKSFFADSFYSTFILTLVYLIIFFPCIVSLFFMWFLIFKFTKSLKFKFLYILLLIFSFLPFILNALIFSFLDHYRYFTAVILLNLISLVFLYKTIGIKILIKKNYSNYLNFFFIFSLIYNCFLNTFFSPLTKNVYIFSNFVYNFLY